MPWIQRLAEIANRRFSREMINELDLGAFGSEKSLADIAAALEIATTPPEVAYLRGWPAAQQEAVRAALFSALNREPRLPVTFAWTPAYDYEVAIFESAGTSESIGGMTIILRSRYPGDDFRASLTARGETV
jgi:hypothetical protein